MPEQPPGSYFYAELFIGADDADALQAKYEDCIDLLDFEFREVEPAAGRSHAS